MTDRHPTDEGGEAPCFAHLLDEAAEDDAQISEKPAAEA